VVVAGGYGEDGLLSFTEILDLNDLTWLKGPSISVYGAGNRVFIFFMITFQLDLVSGMVEDGNGGVILIGGRQDSSDRFDTFYKYNMESVDWQLLPQRLEDDREYPVAFFIPDKFTNCY